MTDRRRQDDRVELSGAGEDGAAEPMSAEEAQELVELARSGELEVPAGADGLAEALLVVAAERDEHYARLQRALADYQNFQRRAANNEREARQSGMAGVVQSILSIMDHFDLALQQDTSVVSADQISAGVRVIRGELLRVLGNHGVSVIEPAPGEDFEPGRHEAIMQQPTDAVAPGTVALALQAGYTLGERVIRPAKVAVAAANPGATPSAPPAAAGGSAPGDAADELNDDGSGGRDQGTGASGPGSEGAD